jgi:hypothetical protein
MRWIRARPAQASSRLSRLNPDEFRLLCLELRRTRTGERLDVVQHALKAELEGVLWIVRRLVGGPRSRTDPRRSRVTVGVEDLLKKRGVGRAPLVIGHPSTPLGLRGLHRVPGRAQNVSQMLTQLRRVLGLHEGLEAGNPQRSMHLERLDHPRP